MLIYFEPSWYRGKRKLAWPLLFSGKIVLMASLDLILLLSFKSLGKCRLECLKLIQNGLADFAPFEPEDMYIAAKFMDDSLAVFLEMRNALTQLGNKPVKIIIKNNNNKLKLSEIDLFRFLSVAVVRNDANINYPADLRGKVSCHTGYGRTAGWHMPIPRVLLL